MKEPVNLLNLVRGCQEKDHKLKTIYEKCLNPGSNVGHVSEVVKWCTVCGSIIVDEDVDGIVQSGKIMKMKSPRLFREI